MDSLPVELLHNIFEPVCSPPGPLLDELPAEDAARLLAAPCTLAAVCRSWRDVCMRIPQIWSFIYLDMNSTAAHLPYIRRQLKRSAGMSIDFVLTAVDVMVFHDHLRLLGKHARQWRRVTIRFTSEIPRDVCTIFQQRMPRLEQLRLLSHAGIQSGLLDRSWYPESPKKYLEMSSHLNHLESHIMVIVPSTQWRSLRFLNYNLRYIVEDSLWLTLAHTPALEELNVFLPQWMTAPVNSQPLTTTLDLPKLQRLGVFGFLGVYLGSSSWPELLRAPRLETLTVSLESCNHLGALFRAPAIRQQIRHLTLTTIEKQSGGFLNRPDADAMGEFRQLETLELRGLRRGVLKDYDQTFFSYLAGEDGAPAPVWANRLKRLILRDCRFHLTACTSLGHYIHSRLAAAQNSDGPAFDFDFGETQFSVENNQGTQADQSHDKEEVFAAYTVQRFDY